MQDRWQDLTANRDRGSSELLNRFLKLAPGLAADEFFTALEQLKTAFPLMAVWTFAGQFFQRQAFNNENLVEFSDRVQQASTAVIRQALETIRKPQRFLTISRSSLVEKFLLERSHQLTRKVFCLESLPAGEGRDLAGVLHHQQLPAECISGWEMETVLQGSDAVLLGADWVAEQVIINKWGSARLLSLADKYKKPVYILAEAYKQQPLPENLRTGDFQQDWSDRTGLRKIQVFESVKRRPEHILISSLYDLQ